MKRSILGIALCLCLISAIPASASSLFFAVLRPFAQYDSALPAASAIPSAELYADYYKMPALANFGWELTGKNVDLAVRFDLRYDFWAYITSAAHGNIPFIENGVNPVLDFNYPTVGYASWGNEKALISFGRRQLKWGPGTYDIALSDAAPYFDNIWAHYKSKANYGTWWANFVAISMDRAAANGGNYYKIYEGGDSKDPTQKTVLAHRIGFENDFLRVGFGELNVVYGVTPDLQDIGPLLVYHHLYQDANSNVLMSLSAETKIGPVRAFGEFVMDDLTLGFENSADKPTSLGWFFGGEIGLLGREAFKSERISESDYALKEATFAEPRGLTIGFEHYRTTTYLYNRSEDAGKFTVPDHRFTFSNGYVDDPAAYFVGFLYGPNTSLDMVTLRHESGNVKARLLLKRLRQGSYGILDDYVPGSNTLDWYALTEPVSETWIAELTGAYAFSKRLLVEGLAAVAFGDDPGFRVGAGASWRIDAR